MSTGRARGSQRLTEYEIEQLVQRLTQPRAARGPRDGATTTTRKSLSHRAPRHLEPEQLEALTARLSQGASQRAPDAMRILPRRERQTMGLLASYAWRGWN
ncbi:unnamed protein product [Lampetra planeri]